MFIQARGRGILIAVVAVVCLVLGDFLAGLYFHDSNYYAQHGWPKLAAFWVAAGLIQLMLPRRPEEVLGAIHAPETQPSVLREKDALLLIPGRYCPAVLLGLGIVFYFLKL
jgi:hypothetical protein